MLWGNAGRPDAKLNRTQLNESETFLFNIHNPPAEIRAVHLQASEHKLWIKPRTSKGR